MHKTISSEGTGVMILNNRFPETYFGDTKSSMEYLGENFPVLPMQYHFSFSKPNVLIYSQVANVTLPKFKGICNLLKAKGSIFGVLLDLGFVMKIED